MIRSWYENRGRKAGKNRFRGWRQYFSLALSLPCAPSRSSLQCSGKHASAAQLCPLLMPPQCTNNSVCWCLYRPCLSLQSPTDSVNVNLILESRTPQQRQTVDSFMCKINILLVRYRAAMQMVWPPFYFRLCILRSCFIALIISLLRLCLVYFTCVSLSPSLSHVWNSVTWLPACGYHPIFCIITLNRFAVTFFYLLFLPSPVCSVVPYLMSLLFCRPILIPACDKYLEF